MVTENRDLENVLIHDPNEQYGEIGQFGEREGWSRGEFLVN